MYPGLAEQLTEALRRKVGHLRFGGERREADYAAWTEAMLVAPETLVGRGVDWAADWINHGYPEPPAWFPRADKDA